MNKIKKSDESDKSYFLGHANSIDLIIGELEKINNIDDLKKKINNMKKESIILYEALDCAEYVFIDGCVFCPKETIAYKNKCNSM